MIAGVRKTDATRATAMLTFALRCRVFILLWRFFGTAITTLALRELTLPHVKRAKL